MAKANARSALAGTLLELLRRQREAGECPLTAARLAALAGPGVTAEQALKALAAKPFAAEVALAHKKDGAVPLALAADAERLAASPQLLDFALNRACTATKPLQPLTKIVSQVEKSLRPAFEAALRRRLEEGALPPEAASQTVRGKWYLYLKRLPPPVLGLSERLVGVLKEQRGRGAGAYPVPLGRLVEMAGAAPAALVKKALAADPFRSRAVVALARRPDAPVALATDCDTLAASPLLLQVVLNAARTADNQAIGLADLKKKLVKPLQQAFEAALVQHITEGTLPAGVGCLRIKKRPHLFLFADLGAPAPAPPAPAPPADFARRFAEAFDRLDRARGSHNLVSLVGLRRELPVDRAAFDVELQRLRRAGFYSLSAAEGRHGISTEEREAAIPEDGSLLLFVSRRGT
jgi:hypothetical protein